MKASITPARKLITYAAEHGWMCDSLVPGSRGNKPYYLITKVSSHGAQAYRIPIDLTQAAAKSYEQKVR